MKITTVRRLSQIFFLLLFLWFCITATIGINWWQLRGWPVNWFLELDPLVGFSTLLTTGKIYKGLLWGVATVILTLIFGRFFCGWVCPFGTLHQFVGFLSNIGKNRAERSNSNKYNPAQTFKYAVLFFFIASNIVTSPIIATYLLKTTPISQTINQLLTGLLDPIPFVYRFVNLTLLPFADKAILHLSANQRYYDGAWIIGLFGIVALLLNLWIPRFYCRYICPLGALFGLVSTISFWQIGKRSAKCTNCMKCQFHCEGACEPMEGIRLSECILCVNCLDHCEYLTYQSASSMGEQHSMPDISRRAFMASVISGVTVVPMMHLDGSTENNWNPHLIRPPGSLPENQFLSRCIKCGQCMRVCPTNVIQPADIFTAGFQGLWTPALNFRIGSSGCQLHCIACGNLCPTGAILPLSLDQRFGINDYKEKGPVRIGTAFVDQGRCLPWAMNRPCIVCQENCPVSPKAIMVNETFVVFKRCTIKSIVSSNSYDNLQSQNKLKSGDNLQNRNNQKNANNLQDENGNVLNLDISNLIEGSYSTGDYYAKDMTTLIRQRIVANTKESITISSKNMDRPDRNGFKVDSKIAIEVRLQRPFIDPSRCIGCGVCEHECPVKGQRAIRITAENESRNKNHILIG